MRSGDCADYTRCSTSLQCSSCHSLTILPIWIGALSSWKRAFSSGNSAWAIRELGHLKLVSSLFCYFFHKENHWPCGFSKNNVQNHHRTPAIFHSWLKAVWMKRFFRLSQDVHSTSCQKNNEINDPSEKITPFHCSRKPIPTGHIAK